MASVDKFMKSLTDDFVLTAGLADCYPRRRSALPHHYTNVVSVRRGAGGTVTRFANSGQEILNVL
jgi:hypothetical protein